MDELSPAELDLLNDNPKAEAMVPASTGNLVLEVILALFRNPMTSLLSLLAVGIDEGRDGLRALTSE